MGKPRKLDYNLMVKKLQDDAHAKCLPYTDIKTRKLRRSMGVQYNLRSLDHAIARLVEAGELWKWTSPRKRDKHRGNCYCYRYVFFSKSDLDAFVTNLKDLPLSEPIQGTKIVPEPTVSVRRPVSPVPSNLPEDWHGLDKRYRETMLLAESCHPSDRHSYLERASNIKARRDALEKPPETKPKIEPVKAIDSFYVSVETFSSWDKQKREDFIARAKAYNASHQGEV